MTDANSPDPSRITGQLISAFKSAALLGALELEVFTALGDGPLTGEEIARRLGVHSRRLLPILHVLMIMGLLHSDGHRFSNGMDAAHYLVRGKASYIGGIYELYNDLIQAALRTAESIRRNHPAAEHDFSQMTDEQLGAFFRGIHAFGVVQGRELAAQRRFDRFALLADVGGGSGNMAIGACEACPNLRATVLELERIVPIARQFVAEAGLGDRVSAQHCNITLRPPDAAFDVAIVRNLIQVLDPDQAASALRNIGKCVRSGGEIYVIGYVLDDSRSIPWEAAAYDVAFINIYPSGQSYTESEYNGWLSDAGFVNIERTLLSNKMSLIAARKA